jgi:subfamily B ATP-binding cassette protein HlyB/CyaB
MFSLAAIGAVRPGCPVWRPIYNASRSTLPAVTGAIKFDQVTLRYRVDGAEILHDVNFNMPAALEVIETPASPAGRAVAAAIIGIFFFLWGGYP